MRITEQEINEILRRARISDSQILGVVEKALYAGTLPIVTRPPTDNNFAGGTNLCPNSDFSFSHLAATVPGTSPADASADNKRLYRCFRQAVGANISATGVREATEEADAFMPVWNKTYGVVQLGAVDEADNHDIAIQFTQNWAIPAQTWYVRIACASIDDTPMPDGLRLYAGLWGKQGGGTEGWLEASLLSITAKKFYVPAATTVTYKVIAKTDTGVSIESQTLTITDAPATFDNDNYVRIDYDSIAGFVEFFVYREKAGVVSLIAYERNSTNLRAFDTGQVGTIQQNGFPTASLDKPRAYAEVEVDCRPITVAKITNNLTLKIPSYDTTLLALEGAYLRIGLIGETAINRQIIIDTVWAGTSFNRWSVSPYDNYGSLPSVAITTGIETGGINGGIPPQIGGGSSCVASWMDLLSDKDAQEWVTIGEAEVGQKIENGAQGNKVKKFIDGEVSQYYVFKFSNGLVVPCTFSHYFIRSFKDGSGICSQQLQVGDTVQGGLGDRIETLTVIEKRLVEGQLPVRAVKVEEGSNLFYAVGNRKTGAYVYCHNRKEYEFENFYGYY
jgi:hypothetical protein